MTRGADRLAAILHQGGDDLHLPLCFLLASVDHVPDLDVDLALSRYEALQEGASQRVGGRNSRDEVVRRLNAYFFEELGFRGNDSDYYDERNNFLHEVVNRRLGIPLTLSVLYRDAVRRVGLPGEGIGLPGHFVVRVGTGDEARYVDPFRGGDSYDIAECRRRVRATLGRSHLPADIFQPRSDRAILHRGLLNLKMIYAREQRTESALKVVTRILQVSPGDLAEVRDRGLLRLELGQCWLAVDDMRAYLKGRRNAPDRMRVRYMMRQALENALRLN